MVAVQSGVDPVYTSTHWSEVLENLYDPNLDDVVLQYDEHEICSILGQEGQEQRERDAIAKRREWMAVVAQRREASAEPVYPNVKLAPTTRELVGPERLPKPPFDPYDVVGLDGDGHSTGADFERAFEEDMRKRAAAASEEE